METVMKPMQPVLETPRLDLRPIRDDDIGLMSLYTSDLRVARMTSSIPHPNPPGAVEAFVASTRKDTEGLTWAIDATRGFGTPLVGLIGLTREQELGYWIAPFFWGLGIASEAVGAVVAYSKSRGDDRIWAGAFKENPASQNVLTKAGLVRYGEREIHSVSRGCNVESWLYEKHLSDD